MIQVYICHTALEEFFWQSVIIVGNRHNKCTLLKYYTMKLLWSPDRYQVNGYIFYD